MLGFELKEKDFEEEKGVRAEVDGRSGRRGTGARVSLEGGSGQEGRGP